MEAIGKFNGGMLMLARHVRGLELTEVAEATDIDRLVLLRYESGAQYPTQAHVHQLGELLRFPVSFFLQEGQAKPPLGHNIQWFAGS